MADQVQPEAGSLPLGAHIWRRQPDLGHKRSSRELGQHECVDLVRLGGQRCQAAHALRIGDEDVPAGELELVVDEAHARHALNGRPHRLAFAGDPPREPAQGVAVRGNRDCHYRAAVLAEQMDVKPLA